MSKTIIILASNKKEAKEIALKQYGKLCTYVSPYKYSSKGNNFYQFDMQSINLIKAIKENLQ